MRPSFFRHYSLKIQIIGLVLTVIIIILIILGMSFSNILIKSIEQSVGNNALEYARFMSHIPIVEQSVENKSKEDLLQSSLERYSTNTQANPMALVVIDQKGIRYVHPRRELIGGHITGGAEGPAINEGRSYYSKSVGISGPAIHSFAPITDSTGKQIGVVSIGIFQPSLDKVIKQHIPSILIWLLIGLTIGILGSILLAGKVKRILHGYEPEEIARLFKEKESMLECLREGVIAIDRASRITLINKAARDMLSLSEDTLHRKMEEIIPISSFASVMETGNPEQDIEVPINNSYYLVNNVPIREKNKIIGAIISFRDISEVRQLAQQLTGVEIYVEGLRAKTHEFMNKLQTISGLLELEEYQGAKEYIIKTANLQQKLFNCLNHRVHDPTIFGLLLGKMQQAEELHIRFTLAPGSHLGKMHELISVESIILILGNLLQNAIEALKAEPDGEIVLTMLDLPDKLVILVEDNGPGIPPTELDLIFKKGFSTKGSMRGYGLYLVHHHVKNIMSGNIHVYSNTGEGTMFSIEIPKGGVYRMEQNRGQAIGG